jgi:LacI family transcriptional regulator
MASKSAKTGSKTERKLNIYDIANAAGVSPGTVSRVMNNRDRVKSSTRERVLAAAKELGFQPNSAVRKPEIAIVTEQGYCDRINGYSATLVQHLSFELTKRGYDIQLPEEAIDTLETAYFNGMIVVTHGPSVSAMIQKLEKRIPTIFIDRFPEQDSGYSVSSDHHQSGYLAAEHFAQNGRKKPAFVSNNLPSNKARFEGFQQALKDHGIESDPALNYLSDKGEALYIGLNNLVRAGADAIYVPGSSLEAMEAIHILTYVMKKRVPDDIALIGGENDRISSFLVPPLTTIEEPLREMAQQSVALLGDLIEGKKPEEPRQMLPVRLIRRVSGG